MTDKQKAIELAQSTRGQYIIGQALCKAIDVMEKVEPEHKREYSNIKDMKYLRDNLFPIYHLTQKADKIRERFLIKKGRQVG